MKTLFLMRHAKSSWNDAAQEDIKRPLNERGLKDAPAMGRRLKKIGIAPDLLISSPAVRAISTAKEIAAQLEYPEKNILQEFDIYEAGINDLLHVIRNIDDRYQDVILFGHNPSLTGVVGYLTPTFIDHLPTAGILQIQFDLATWKQVAKQSGVLVSFDYPKNTES